MWQNPLLNQQQELNMTDAPEKPSFMDYNLNPPDVPWPKPKDDFSLRDLHPVEAAWGAKAIFGEYEEGARYYRNRATKGLEAFKAGNHDQALELLKFAEVMSYKPFMDKYRAEKQIGKLKKWIRNLIEELKPLREEALVTLRELSPEPDEVEETALEKSDELKEKLNSLNNTRRRTEDKLARGIDEDTKVNATALARVNKEIDKLKEKIKTVESVVAPKRRSRLALYASDTFNML